MYVWVSEWVSEWVSGRVREWVDVCMYVCSRYVGMYGMYRVCTVQEGKDVKNYEWGKIHANQS